MTLMKTISDGTPTGSIQVQMTADEENEFLAAQQASLSESAIDDLKNLAELALNKSDLVATRCFKSGVAFPPEWQAYVTSLRSIVSSGTGDIPTQPSYPSGT